MKERFSVSREIGTHLPDRFGVQTPDGRGFDTELHMELFLHTHTCVCGAKEAFIAILSEDGRGFAFPMDFKAVNDLSTQFAMMAFDIKNEGEDQ